jgi:hypothetical protein
MAVMVRGAQDPWQGETPESMVVAQGLMEGILKHALRAHLVSPLEAFAAAMHRTDVP